MADTNSTPTTTHPTTPHTLTDRQCLDGRRPSELLQLREGLAETQEKSGMHDQAAMASQQGHDPIHLLTLLTTGGEQLQQPEKHNSVEKCNEGKTQQWRNTQQQEMQQGRNTTARNATMEKHNSGEMQQGRNTTVEMQQGRNTTVEKCNKGEMQQGETQPSEEMQPRERKPGRNTPARNDQGEMEKQPTSFSSDRMYCAYAS